MKVGIFLRNLDEILSEFHEHLQKMSKFAEKFQLQKILQKLRKFGQNPETDEIIHMFFLNYSVVSLARIQN